MDFARLSSNLIDIINQILSNQNLVNYIGYNSNNPSLLTGTQKVNPATIAPNAQGQRLFAYPFDKEYKADVRTEVHIYYPNIDIVNNGQVSQTIVNFDIVVHKSIWMLLDDGKKIIRPYQIAKFIYDSFHDKKVGKLGNIHFINASHTIINSEYEGLRLTATFTEF